MHANSLHGNREIPGAIDVIRNRLQTYERESKPVLDYYGKKVLHPINADQTPAKVLFDILRHLVKL